MSDEPFDLVIRGGVVVTADDERRADVGITGSSIAAIAPNLHGSTEIDATGQFVLPGGVDPHVHLTPAAPPPAPGWRDDFWSGSRAAAAGGITTIGNMAFPWPGETLLQAMQRDAAAASRDAVVDVALHPVLTDPDTQPISDLDTLAELGHTTLKYFMSFGGFTTAPDRYLAAMRVAAAGGMPTLIHCEDAALLADALATLVAAGKTALPHYPASRPTTVEAAATARAIAFAEQTGALAYIVHLSCAAALDEVRRGRERGVPIWVETRPLYLFLTEERYAEPDGGKYVGQPPLRTASDVAALWDALAAGEIQTLATDHAPWFYADKVGPGLDLISTPPGVADLDVMLPMLWSHGVTTGRISRQRFAAVSATNAAIMMGLYPRKGTIAVGSDADLVLWNPAETRPVRAESFYSNGDFSPYEGWSLTGWPTTTISRGDIIMRDGKVDAARGRGQLPRRERVPTSAFV
ncbi:MAG: amidohydrolase family protein [Thermomicrobiales bacterium]